MANPNPWLLYCISRLVSGENDKKTKKTKEKKTTTKTTTRQQKAPRTTKTTKTTKTTTTTRARARPQVKTSSLNLRTND